MNLNHLQYFVVLAELEHYTKAAKELSITQPSLSHAIAMMERDLGVQLFERRGRNVVLTAYGREFLTYVKECLNRLDEGVEAVRGMAYDRANVLEVAYIYTLGRRYIPELIRSFLEQEGHEGVRFHFTVGNTDDVLRGLQESQFDVGFCSRVDGRGDMFFTPVTREELVVVVPVGHPLEGRGSVSLEDIIPYPQVYYTESSGLRPLINHMFRMIHKKPRIAYQIEEDTAMAGLVAGGFGIAVMPDIPLLRQLPVSVLRISEPVVERRIYLAYLKNREQSEKGRAFIEFVSGKRIC